MVTPIVQAAAMAGGMQKYHLHMTARVAAEHHVFRPGEEFGKPQNLLSPGEEIWNKWEAENHNRSWVEVEFAEKLHVQGIGFKSAGDHPRKSPTHVRIHVWHLLEGGWREIGHRQLEFGMAFWQKIEFPEIHFEAKKVKFDFHNNRNIQGIQLGEIMFYHLGQGMMGPQVVIEQPRAEVFIQPQP
jgi:hypothetical protein